MKSWYPDVIKEPIPVIMSEFVRCDVDLPPSLPEVFAERNTDTRTQVRFEFQQLEPGCGVNWDVWVRHGEKLPWSHVATGIDTSIRSAMECAEEVILNSATKMKSLRLEAR